MDTLRGVDSLFGVTRSAHEAAEAVGLSYRQVDYLARHQVVTPSIAANGCGTRRRYTPDDLARLRLAAVLLGLGARYPIIRNLLEHLPPVPADWPRYFFVTREGVLKLGLPLPAGCWWISTAELVPEVESEAA